jgi:GTP-binding protein HflX
MDRVTDRALLETLCGRFDAVAISALTPATLPPLMERLEAMIGMGPSPCETDCGWEDANSGK